MSPFRDRSLCCQQHQPLWGPWTLVLGSGKASRCQALPLTSRPGSHLGGILRGAPEGLEGKEAPVEEGSAQPTPPAMALFR